MDRIERIEAMEAALNAAREATDQLSEAVAAQAVALDGLRALSGYYGSQDWYKDREAALGALEVATAMLRAL